ncbi:hypothetical protein FUAX_27830 [Fulvitalea axinellae]|uniref:Uncharacterized protein n=1 Tax=Fulvitalea axinellae TaxID=1182444 RepID=A0AAU9CMR1_9BACT|nr:hypothetical protein FUAX_27830 [Fulvitalea axinellae]
MLLVIFYPFFEIKINITVNYISISHRAEVENQGKHTLKRRNDNKKTTTHHLCNPGKTRR